MILRRAKIIDVGIPGRHSMRDIVRTGAPARSAQATRRDLLLETAALRHQLGVLARSNKSAFAQLPSVLATRPSVLSKRAHTRSR